MTDLSNCPTLVEMLAELDRAEKMFDMTTPTTLFQGVRWTPEKFREMAAEVGKVIERAEQYENVLHDARNEIIFMREWAICKRELIYGDVTWTKAQECVEAITNALGQNPLLPNYRRESEAENE